MAPIHLVASHVDLVRKQELEHVPILLLLVGVILVLDLARKPQTATLELVARVCIG